MTETTLEEQEQADNGLYTEQTIWIKGARANNLKNVELRIPKNKLVVVSGVSGSGKSSITMDTLYAEGQRRYVESLSAYARQFLTRMKKPDVDFIKGICPAIAVEQKVSTSNARSTVGSLTEIYDYLRLLYARAGKTISPVSGHEVRKHQVSDVVDYIRQLPDGSRCYIAIPLQRRYPDRTLGQELDLLLQKGYTRVYVDGELLQIEDFLDTVDNPEKQQEIRQLDPGKYTILVDRFVLGNPDDTFLKRVADSVQTAFDESFGECLVRTDDDIRAFNSRFELDGIEFIEPSPQLFNYNNPYGACPECEGYGRVIGIDDDKVIPDQSLSVYEGAVQAWKGESSSWWQEQFVRAAIHYDFPIHRPYADLTDAEKDLLWNGKDSLEGIHKYFRSLEEKSYKIQNRVILARYRGKTRCPSCRGGRLRKEALYVQVCGHSIADLVLLPSGRLLDTIETFSFSEHDRQIAERLILEITQRLRLMCTIGLSYLHLDRLSSTLSGGEVQRINLTRTLGSNLTSSLYILDEPSVGLHPRDTLKMVSVLQQLRDMGNTVVVVEHEEDIIRQADHLVDMGPEAGIHGGEVVYSGNFRLADPTLHDRSLTVQYLHRRMSIPTPSARLRSANRVYIRGARQHNLKKIDVTIPLQALTVVSGISGSGKSTLVREIVYPGLKTMLGDNSAGKPGLIEELTGDLKAIQQVELVGQSPIGRSSRSNPVTYVKAYDTIRQLFTDQQLSKIRGYKPKHFSFNVEGGRCETCKGDGEIVVEMQFLADVNLPCEECNGMRFKQEILDVRYKEKNIYEVLNLSIEESLDFFRDQPDVIQKLKPLYNVGLGYVKLGQSSSTLSGGEAQRVKLAAFLGQHESRDKIFFIFDEPTTGLHFHDVRRLLDAFRALIDKGHTVLVVEHHLDVIKNADWVIDLGPEAGEEGGELVFQGTPEELVHVEKSYTGRFLLEKWTAESYQPA